MQGMKIVGVGKSLPPKVVENDEMKKYVDTSDEWIYSRTGIRRRHFVDNETNVKLATMAAQQAIEHAGIAKEDIGICIVATFTADDVMPTTATMVQANLSLSEDMIAFDLNAACTGFIFGMKTAQGLLSVSEKKYALLIGSEVISKVLDFSKRETCVLFGDGAGAVILEKNDKYKSQTITGVRGENTLLTCAGVGEKNQTIKMQGQDVFRFAIDIIPKSIYAVLEKENIDIETVDYFVCHQANVRILDRVARKMKIEKEKFYTNLENVGNTSAASIPIALSDMEQEGLLKSGMTIVLVGFGAGLTWGATKLQW